MLEFKKPDAYKNINASSYLVKNKNNNYKYITYLPNLNLSQIIPNNLKSCLVS